MITEKTTEKPQATGASDRSALYNESRTRGGRARASTGPDRPGRNPLGCFDLHPMNDSADTRSSPKPGARRGAVEFGPASEADHEAVYQTLLHVFHGPDRDAFLAAISDPSYAPEQRLLAKVDGKVASHLHLTERVLRYGSTSLPMNGVMWVGTLPEYRHRGFAQRLLQMADQRAIESGAVILALTTTMPRFYRPLGWGVCGLQTFAKAASRNLPARGDELSETGTMPWNVRPWRQVELGDLMNLYDRNYGGTTGSIVRSEDYWRWIIGRRYAHVIWVACQGDRVHGYAFVKDHRILEIAVDPDCPEALNALLGRIRSEALERAYPEVIVQAPLDHPVIDGFRAAKGTVVASEAYEGLSSMYRIPDPGRFLEAILPELSRRVEQAGAKAVELGLTVDDRKWLVKAAPNVNRCGVERGRLGRRYLALCPGAFVRLMLGHTYRRSHRGGRRHRLDRHRAGRRAHPLPPPIDLAQPARQRDGLRQR